MTKIFCSSLIMLPDAWADTFSDSLEGDTIFPTETSHFSLVEQCKNRGTSEHFIITLLTFIKHRLCVNGRHVLIASQCCTTTHLLRSMYKSRIVCCPPTYLQPCLPSILRNSILCLGGHGAQEGHREARGALMEAHAEAVDLTPQNDNLRG
jgi:hypothetical protein